MTKPVSLPYLLLN